MIELRTSLLNFKRWQTYKHHVDIMVAADQIADSIGALVFCIVEEIDAAIDQLTTKLTNGTKLSAENRLLFEQALGQIRQLAQQYRDTLERFGEFESGGTLNIEWPSQKRIYADVTPSRGKPENAYPAFRIHYVDIFGVVTEREIFPVYLQSFENGLKIVHAWCFRRNAMRSFNNWSIDKAINIRTDRPIDDLGRYLRR